MADEAKVSFRGVCQALFSLPFLGLSIWTTPPHPQPGWSPDTKRQPPTVPCCRSMHSGAMSAVSRNVMQGRSVPLRAELQGLQGWDWKNNDRADRCGPFYFH